ncbi:MAG: dephospho-CoA kinase, partial [Polyangiaceae bacterium]
APGSAGLRAIVREFGEAVLDSDGALDRKAMARIVFSDAARRKSLNAITHPLIMRAAGDRATDLDRAGNRLACYEAALIVENGAADAFRPLVVVACPEDVQLARIRARDAASAGDALARIRAQEPLAAKVAVADFVIDTTGPIEATSLQTDDVLARIHARLGLDPPGHHVADDEHRR